jgi:tRNA threonylcarbamoyladenosine biosynthesis protein TsaB
LAYADKGWTKLLVAVDARMGEVYWGCYTIHEGFALLQGVESVSSPQALELKALNLEAGESYFGVGSGWHVYSAELEASLSKKPQAIDSEALPKASGIAHLAAFKYKKGEFCDPVDTLPVYLRDNIANTQ